MASDISCVMMTSMPITATDVYRYFQCPHWPYWERFGDPALKRSVTDQEERRFIEGNALEQEIIRQVYGGFDQVTMSEGEDAFAATERLMAVGVPVIYQGWVRADDWVGRPDILEKRAGVSRFGDWYYAPVDIKFAQELRKEHKAQLLFYATLLEKTQGRFPHTAAIINGRGVRIEFACEEFVSEFREIMTALERVCAGERPAPVYRKACEEVSPWGKACFALAHEAHDIALLYNVDVRKLEALRRHGICTIEDAAALDPVTLEGQEYGFTLRALQAIQRQARALSQRMVIIREPMLVSQESRLELYFDIESYPQKDADYLYGIWWQDPSIANEWRYTSFVAEHPEDEEAMWRAFLAWTTSLPPFYLYHYSPYEPQRLRALAARYGDTDHPSVTRCLEACRDIKETVREHVVFPLYFYSLKSICKFLGFQWREGVKNGGDSVDAYEAWLSRGDREVLDAIIRYNEDDVRATAFLFHWLRTYAVRDQVYVEPYPWHYIS